MKRSASSRRAICHDNNDTFTINIMESGVGKHASERESHLARGGATRCTQKKKKEVDARRVSLYEVKFARACVFTHSSNPEKSEGLLVV